jgi:heterodisulfide reductase subunit B
MKFAAFLGCTIPVRGQNYELSARRVCEALGIELVDVPDFSCCGFPVISTDVPTANAMAVLQLSYAEEQGLEIMSLCSACTAVLAEANHRFNHDERSHDQALEYLAQIDRTYNGTVKVRHIARVFIEDIGLDAIREKVVHPLGGLLFAPHYGCHYLKPSKAHDKFDSPEDAHTLDLIIEALGGNSLNYLSKYNCCGGALLPIDESLALSMAGKKLDEVSARHADAMVLFCPFCSVMYDDSQRKIGEVREKDYDLPVVYLTQLMGLAFGMDPRDDLGLNMNRVKTTGLLEKLGLGKGQEKAE